MTRHAVAVAVLGVLLAVTTACSAAGTPVDPHAVLLARPSSEDAVAGYRQMQRRIQSELDAALGRHDWTDVDGGSERTCVGPFDHEDDGRVRTLPQVGFTGGIPDDRWPRAEQIVATIVGEYGFDTAGLLRIDQPGRHELNAHDPRLDAFFNFGAQLNTSMQTTTGCHLPAVGRPPP